MNVLGFDPIFDYIRMMNLFTFGWAARALDISRERVSKFILFMHSSMIFDALIGTLRIFRQVPDWLDHKKLPERIKDKRMS